MDLKSCLHVLWIILRQVVNRKHWSENRGWWKFSDCNKEELPFRNKTGDGPVSQNLASVLQPLRVPWAVYRKSEKVAPRRSAFGMALLSRIFPKHFREWEIVAKLYTKITFSKTQVRFCNFRVLSARGFWTEFSVLNTRKTEKRELYYHNFHQLIRDTSAENNGSNTFYRLWCVGNTSDFITIFGP